MPSEIYIPLRSNAAWFGDSDAKANLVRQFKANLVLYDRLRIQDGRYHVSAGTNNQGIQIPFRGDSYPGDRTKINYSAPGAPFGITVQGQTLLNSISEVTYEVDFLPIITEARLEDASCIHWCDFKLIPVIESGIRQRVVSDLHDQGLCRLLPSNRYIRQFMLESLYYDATVANAQKLPFCVDHNTFPLIDEQKRRAAQSLSEEIPSAVFRYWLNLQLPDVTQLSWQEVYEFRESDIGRSFREMIHRIAGRVSEVVAHADDQQDVDQWVSREFSKELLEALSSRIKSPHSTVVNVLLNFIPFGSLASMAMDASGLEADQNSWVALVQGYKLKK